MHAVTANGAPVAISDDQLLQGCLRRDEAAVRELTRRYNQRLFRVARGIVRNDADAEDVVQEAYTRAFTHLDRFRGDSSVGTWLVRIAMNEALQRLRAKRPTVDVDDVPLASADAGPEVRMANQEIRSLIERAIDELPDGFRTVFVARVVEGLSVEETAELFHLRPETVKTRVHRARRALRRSIEGQLGVAVSEAFSFDGPRCEALTGRVIARLTRPS
jgi:RNA polymerase sigma-70 factor, ECF subfamily